MHCVTLSRAAIPNALTESLRSIRRNAIPTARRRLQVRHRACSRLIASCMTRQTVYVAIELAKGEMLLNWLLRKKRCTELEAAVIMNGIVQGVHYLHSLRIVHRDLKLENLMFAEWDNIDGVKIIDFGFSKRVDEGTLLQTVCGSPQYVAPEILTLSKSKSYTHAVDCWSIGVIMYMLLSGYAPFGETL